MGNFSRLQEKIFKKHLFTLSMINAFSIHIFPNKLKLYSFRRLQFKCITIDYSFYIGLFLVYAFHKMNYTRDR